MASVVVLAASALAAVWAAAMLTPFGRVGYYYFFVYAEFYMGVLTLVSLSITVMLGLVATNRLVLSIRQRVLLQSAHRATGVIAVASLVVHVWTKLIEQHIDILDIFIPFVASFNTLFVGFGTLSGILMVLIMWSGLARSRFIGRGKPWMWRAFHSISYLVWPIALVHGLAAGRAAATWVIVSYIVCVLFVLVALAVRLSVSLNRRKDFSSTATGNLKPVGSLVPTQAAPAKKKPARRREPEPSRAPAAVETWKPAASPVSPAVAAPVSARPSSARPTSSMPASSMPASAMPASSMPMSAMPASAMPASGMPVSGPAYADDGYGRRYADDDAPRSRRSRAEEYGEVTGRISRRAIEEEEQRYAEPRGRRYAGDDEPRGRRYADDDEPVRRSRRGDTGEFAPVRGQTGEFAPVRGETGEFAPVRGPLPPKPGRRYADDEMPPPRRAIESAEPRGRRYADNAEPRGRRYAEPDEPRGRRYAEPDEPPRGRRYAEDPYTDAPRSRARYADDEIGDAPRSRRDRGADVDRADSGRHSRSEFVDLAEPADPWQADPNYMEPDETPTLVDMAARRARRQDRPETARASRGARRNRARTTDEALDDQQYWRQLRGEAQ